MRRRLKHCPFLTQEQMALFVRNKWLKYKNTRQFILSSKHTPSKRCNSKWLNFQNSRIEFQNHTG